MQVEVILRKRKGMPLTHDEMDGNLEYLEYLVQRAFITHVNNVSNPHGVTPEQIGAVRTKDFEDHLNDTSNPHGITPEMIGAVDASHLSETNPHGITPEMIGAATVDQVDAKTGKVYASPSDTLDGYLDEKIISGKYVQLTLENLNGGKVLKISADHMHSPDEIVIGSLTTFEDGYNPYAAVELAEAAAAKVDTKTTVYYQSTAPDPAEVVLVDGDFWIDSDNGNKAYVWRASQGLWVEVTDARVQTALDQAFTATALADGKATVFYSNSDSPPSGQQSGDIWFQLDTRLVHVWDGSQWVQQHRGAIVTSSNSAPANPIDGDIWYDTDQQTFFVWSEADSQWKAQYITANASVGDTPPANPIVGDIWYDTNTATFKEWNGSSWVNKFSHTLNYQQPTPPSNPKDGDVWYDTNDGVFYIWSATDNEWKIQFKGSRSYYGSTPPSNPEVGEVWYDTTSKTFKTWNGSGWVEQKHPVASATAPSNPSDGDIWYDTDQQTFFIWSAAENQWKAQFVSANATVNSAAPSNPAVGDIWYDTNTATFKEWNGSSWVNKFSHTLNYQQPTAPPNPKDGDVWYDTNDGVFYIWSATDNEWKVQFKGMESYYGPTPPENPQIGTVWFDSNANLFYMWDGSVWVNQQVGVRTFYSDVEPTTQAAGDIWHQPSTGITQYWDGSQWLPYGDRTDTVIKKGLITTGTLQVADGANNVQAGITGTEDTNPADTDVRIWAGSDYNNRDSAKFRVQKNGTVIANSVIVESGQEGFIVRGADGATTRLSDGRLTYTDPNGVSSSFLTKVQTGRCTHNSPVTFSPAFEDTPFIIMSPDGMTWPSSLVNPAVLDCYASEVSSTGFTPVVRLREGVWSQVATPHSTIASLTVDSTSPYGTNTTGSSVFTINSTTGARVHIYLDLLAYATFNTGDGEWVDNVIRCKADLKLYSSPAGANAWTLRSSASYSALAATTVTMEVSGLPSGDYDFKVDCTLTYYHKDFGGGSVWIATFTAKLSRYDKLSSFTEVVIGDAYYLAIGR